jgi:octaprenyl-diphosphate synthase
LQTQDPIKKLRLLFKEDFEKVDSLIKHLCSGKEKLIELISDYLLSAGGKRLRPLLTLVCAKMCNYQGDKHISLAAAVEFIHSATLLHDDVVDDSHLRRGKPTANDNWGNKASILVGDFLLSQAFQIMVRSESLKVLEILSKASAVIAEGEVMQLSAVNNIEIKLEDYIKIIEAKTAELFSAACQIGPVIAVKDLKYQYALRDFGLNLGIAFQIMDDVLDYSASEAALGKTIGDDFREGKITLPVIFAYEAGNDDEKEFWTRVMREVRQEEDDLEHALSLINKYDTINKSIATANNYLENARATLNIFNQSEEKSILIEILDFSTKRSY